MVTDAHDQAHRHDPVYDKLHATAEFRELKSNYRRFAVPATVAFLSWYLLYVVLSNWAPDLMGTQVVGNVNVALVFGLLQFATTFALAFAYARYSNAKLDPIARHLDEEYAHATSTSAGTGTGTTEGGAR
ncbi:MAG: DUF485 domain-containing protein [Nocardioides sp.]|uniref:DUF485 domain-containing protein n=1 Tax=Nocardioides sp. TaxID=35761 RepID=UPI0039E6AAA0